MQIESLLTQEARAALIAEKMKLSAESANVSKWPDRHLHNEDNKPVPFHTGQNLVFDSKSRIVAMIAGSQAGKALSLDTLIPTPFGFREIRDIQINDIVYGGDGNETRVVYTSKIFYGHDCYKLTFDDGSTIVADGDHLWITRNHLQRKNDARRVLKRTRSWNFPRVTGTSITKTSDMAKNVIVKNTWCNYSIDVCNPIKGIKENLELHPYVLGCWLGDGHSKSPKITTADKEIIERIKSIGIDITDLGHGNSGKATTVKLGFNTRTKDKFHRQINNVTQMLKDIDVLKNKHIPDKYLFADIQSRKDLLAGLLDTDGYCNKLGQAEFYTTNEILCNDVLKLVSSLGYKARFRKKVARLYGKDCGYVYAVIFASDESPFYLKRKSEKHKSPIKQNTKRRYIVSIEKINSVPTKCIAVDNYDHSYLVGKTYIITHNTSVAPWWIYNEMNRLGGGDYLAVTSTYDLFKLKFLPAMITVFEQILGIGRYWAGDKVLEIKDPKTNTFLASRSTDRMYARIILRSADALTGLESATANAALLDECGMDKFTFNAYKAIRRRLALQRGRILMTTTLYNFGWIVQHILDPAVKTGKSSFFYENGGEIQQTISESKDTTIVQLDSIVNPQFPKEEFLEAAELLSEEEFNMFYRGRKSTRRFLIYDVFDPSPDKHICTPFKIPDDWKRYWGMDYGGEHMAVIFLAEEPTTKRLYAYREYLEGGKDVNGFTDDIVKNEIAPYKCYGGSKSEENWRREFRWHGTSVEEPTVSDVNLGISRTYAVIKNDGIIFFKNLTGTIDELGRYRRVRDENGNATDKILDKDTFHLLDALRYIVSSIRPGVSLRARAVNVSEVLNYD